jgi:hypothetical protein
MKTSRGELEGWYRDAITRSRIWIQEHGELGLIVGVLLGILLVLFFRWCLTLIVVGLLGGRLIWGLAER